MTRRRSAPSATSCGRRILGTLPGGRALLTGAAVLLCLLAARPGRAEPPPAAGDRIWTELPVPATQGPPGKGAVALRSFADLAARASPAVVNISVGQRLRPAFASPYGDPYGNPQLRQTQPRGLGTGFIIHADGYVLTNAHVVEEADVLQVTLANEHRYSARLVGIDPRVDVALLKIEPTEPLAVVPLGDSDQLSIGEWVMAIGNPFGLSHTVTVGIISAKGRSEVAPSGRHMIANYLQTDASINPGNSGGPLLNTRGEVVGMNSAVNAAGQGIGFAIPVNMLKHLLPMLREGRVERTWLGVLVRDIDEELAAALGLPTAQGALVEAVVPDGPADKAGVQAGDAIVEFRGTPVRNRADVLWQAAGAAVGEHARLVAYRNGRPIDLAVVLERLPDRAAGLGRPSGVEAAPEAAGTGLQLADLTPELSKRLRVPSTAGAAVVAVEAGSPADLAGLRAGDVLTAVGAVPVRDRQAALKALAGVKPGQIVSLVILRGGRRYLVVFRRE